MILISYNNTLFRNRNQELGSRIVQQGSARTTFNSIDSWNLIFNIVSKNKFTTENRPKFESFILNLILRICLYQRRHLKLEIKIKSGSKAEDASRVIVIIINMSLGKYNLNSCTTPVITFISLFTMISHELHLLPPGHIELNN